MILGVLDMPDCIVSRWYSCLVMKFSSYKVRFFHHPLYWRLGVRLSLTLSGSDCFVFGVWCSTRRGLSGGMRGAVCSLS